MRACPSKFLRHKARIKEYLVFNLDTHGIKNKFPYYNQQSNDRDNN